MQSDKQSPKTDDFRLERDDGTLVVTFTPDGRTYAFPLKGDQLLDPTVSPPQVAAADYADDEVRSTAVALARLALRKSP